MRTLLFSMPGNESMADRLRNRLDCERGRATVRRFPDGETYVRLESNVRNARVLVLESLRNPDEKFLPLQYFSRTASELGASSIVLVAPYLSYMRQDTRFREGEALTSRYFADLVGAIFDGLVTVDPHLHRTGRLDDIYTIPTEVAQSAGPIAEWIRANVEDPILIGPDMESEQWVSNVARRVDVPYVVLRKERHGDRDVDVAVPDVADKSEWQPVILDDIISTGGTTATTLNAIRGTFTQDAICIGIHAVFSDNAESSLVNAGAREVVTCDTIVHPSNRIDVSGVLGDAIERLFRELDT